MSLSMQASYPRSPATVGISLMAAPREEHAQPIPRTVLKRGQVLNPNEVRDPARECCYVVSKAYRED